MTKMAKLGTLFMIKTVEKPYPFEAAHTYLPHIGEHPTSPGPR